MQSVRHSLKSLNVHLSPVIQKILIADEYSDLSVKTPVYHKLDSSNQNSDFHNQSIEQCQESQLEKIILNTPTIRDSTETGIKIIEGSKIF